jgi:hypothetical protein
MWIQIPLFILMRIQIRILLFIKLMPISHQLSIEPPWLHFEPPRLHYERPPWLCFELLQLLNFDFEPDPASQNNADPDPLHCNMPSKKQYLAQPALVSLRIPFRVRGISWTTPPNMPAHNTILILFLIQTTLSLWRKVSVKFQISATREII